MDKINYWDREEVIERIQQLYRCGRDISYVGVLENYPTLLFASVYYYKNWGSAITSAGLDYSKVRKQQVWSKEKIMSQLKKYKMEKQDFRYNEFEKKYPKLFHAAVYHLGSWENACSVIGLNYRKIKKFTDWNREKIKKKIKLLYKKGIDISYRAMRKSGEGKLVSAGNFYFGNWGKAVIAGGLSYAEIRKK